MIDVDAVKAGSATMSVLQHSAVVRRPSTAAQTAINPPRVRLRDVVEMYMKNRLPRDLHPSYQAIDERVAATRPTLPASSQTESNFQALHLQSGSTAESEVEELFSVYASVSAEFE